MHHFQKMHRLKMLILVIVSISLIGCAATHTAISKRHLDVQTKMSETIFLDPVLEHQKTVYLQIRNTSGQPRLNLENSIAHALRNKGFTLVANPNEAHYLIQANVLQVTKTNLRESTDVLEQGFGGGLASAGAAGALGGNSRTALGVGLAGAAVSLVTDAMVKDIRYNLITDLQISEKTHSDITESLTSNLKQGAQAQKTLTAKQSIHWKRYQTRIISTANKVNLSLDQALPELSAGLSHSITGIM